MHVEVARLLAAHHLAELTAEADARRLAATATRAAAGAGRIGGLRGLSHSITARMMPPPAARRPAQPDNAGPAA